MTEFPALPSPSAGELLPLPGRNTGSGVLTRAATDHEAINGWLAKYLDSPHTLASYRKDADRLLAWLDYRGLGMRDMTVEDATAYPHFLRDPQPRARFCLAPTDGSDRYRREPRFLAQGVSNPAYRPFVTGLSEPSIKKALTILFTCFEHLTAVGYLAANPFRASRKRSTGRARTGIDRYLERPVLDTLLASIEGLPQDTPRQIAHYERSRFLVRFLFLTGLRISEMAAATTARILLKRGKHWLRVLGKGQVEADIPLQQDALAALRQYRTSLGLEPMPLPGEDAPLVMDLWGKGALSTAALHQIIKAVFAHAADGADPHTAAVLKKASCHWFRHSTASLMLAAGADLLTVRGQMRHTSIATTNLYLHSAPDSQHEDAEKLRI